MSLLVDTSVWSLAFRRDSPPFAPAVDVLLHAIGSGDTILTTTGLVLQELLQGFTGPKQRRALIDRFAALPLLVPDREDHVEAAELRNLCRRRGVQVGTIDALLAQLCIAHDLTLLTTDADFSRIAKLSALKVWPA